MCDTFSKAHLSKNPYSFKWDYLLALWLWSSWKKDIINGILLAAFYVWLLEDKENILYFFIIIKNEYNEIIKKFAIALEISLIMNNHSFHKAGKYKTHQPMRHFAFQNLLEVSEDNKV